MAEEATGAAPAAPAAPAVYDAPFDVTAHVPEALRTEPHFSSFKGKTLGDVIKSGVEAQKAIGGSVRIPGADAKPEDWTAFYSKTRGAVPSPDKYSVKWGSPEIGKSIEESAGYAMVKQAAFDNGISDRQLSAILKAHEDGLAADKINFTNQVETGKVQGKNAIKTKYGSEYDNMNIMANRAAKRFGGDAFVKLIGDYGLSTDPTFFETFANIAKAVHEDSWHGGETPKFLSRDAAGKQANAIMADKSHAYHNASHAQHAAAVTQMDSLRKIQYAKKEAED